MSLLENIKQFLKKIFPLQSEQESLDAFITSKQPTSIHDVEHWIYVYDRRNRNW